MLANRGQNLVLLVFALLLHETLTGTTIGLVLLGVGLSFSGIRTTKLVRNLLALGIFASYWITYGKIIDPEVGINFLTSIIVLKILEKETVRDSYMVFMGLVLLISAGSLFEKTLTYVLFFGGSFVVLMRDFYAFVGQRLKPRDLGYLVFWIFPLTLVLFFFVPRMMNPIPFKQLARGEGEVGYTTEVKVSEVESLSSNAEPVFQALLSEEFPQGELYWRGNTLSSNDGWNWHPNHFDKSDGELILGVNETEDQFTQDIRTFEKADFIFSLDYPRALHVGGNYLAFNKNGTLPQKRWQWHQRYKVIGQKLHSLDTTEHLKNYLQVNLTPETKEWIDATFPARDLKLLSRDVTTYLRREGFTYSLSPGKSSDFNEFMRSKKTGFCSHYASALAIILRARGVPARLVSGFMGGTFNKFGEYYLVTQNDAHVWVEALSDDHWVRLDPTAWIAPDRVRLGAEAFYQDLNARSFLGARLFRLPPAFLELKQWFSQWDFSFYNWLEQMDYYSQDAWFSRIRFKREWLLSLLPLLMVAFMGLYSLYLKLKSSEVSESELQKLWGAFYRKIRKRGVQLSTVSVSEAKHQLAELDHPEKEKYLQIWDGLVEASFGTRSDLVASLKKQIRKI